MNLENETMAPLQIGAQVCGGEERGGCWYMEGRGRGVCVHGGKEVVGGGTWREGGEGQI